MASDPTHIVDASALIAYFKQEAGYQNFSSLLADDQNILAVHATNLCEVYYTYLRSDGPDKAEEAWRKATTILGVVEKLDAQFIKRVGRWKVDYNLPLGDAFAAATAEDSACALVTTDHNDFGPIESAGALQIVWLR
ncbi:MAG: PIN domain-containing protein [Candidatus Binatia bacterium]